MCRYIHKNAYMLCLLMTCCMNCTYGQEESIDIVQQWAQSTSALPYTALTWEVHNIVLDRNNPTNVRQQIIIEESYVYRWPDCMVGHGRVVKSQMYADPALSMRFDWDRSINVAGQHKKYSPGHGVFKELSPVQSLVDILKTESVNAPYLLGLWLDETGDTIKTHILDDGRVQASFPFGGLVLTLTRVQSTQGREYWGVDDLEVQNDHGELIAGWRFDDLFIPDGFPFAVGRVRVPYSPNGEGAPSKLISITTINEPPDELFELDLTKAVTIDPRTGKILNNKGEIVGHTSATHMQRLRMYWPVIVGLIAGVLLLIAGGIRIYKRRGTLV